MNELKTKTNIELLEYFQKMIEIRVVLIRSNVEPVSDLNHKISLIKDEINTRMKATTKNDIQF